MSKHIGILTGVLLGTLLGVVATCMGIYYNPWIRDLLPEDTRPIESRRLTPWEAFTVFEICCAKQDVVPAFVNSDGTIAKHPQSIDSPRVPFKNRPNTIAEIRSFVQDCIKEGRLRTTRFIRCGNYLYSIHEGPYLQAISRLVQTCTGVPDSVVEEYPYPLSKAIIRGVVSKTKARACRIVD